MKETHLKFIGTGSAFNTDLGNTSAYIKYDNDLLLIDCGESIFERLIKNDILNKDIKGVNIFITHTHPDHCGSLGTAIFYCKYTLGIQVNLFCTNRKIEDMLTIQMVPNNIYDFIQIKCDIPVFIGNREFNGPIKIIPIETKHVKDPIIKNPISSGFLIKVKNTVLYYGGDSYEIPDAILELLKNNELDYIYQDTCGIDYPENVHLFYDNLKAVIPVDNRHSIYCMHLDGYLKAEDILSDGFNVVQAGDKSTSIAIYPGSFDPITNGHLNMIEKASKMFDKVIVAVLINEKKYPMFSMEKRIKQITKCINKYPNIEVKMFTGLVADFAKQEQANILIRGLRSVTDFEYELQIGMTNKQLNSDLETVLLIPDAQYQYMSSSTAKEIAHNHGNINWIVPSEILEEIKEAYHY